MPTGRPSQEQAFAKATLLGTSGAYVTLYTHHFPGYAAFTVAVGIEDGSENHPGTVTVSATIDGRVFKNITKSYGQAATQLTVPFGQASQIKISMHDNQKQTFYVLLGNPTVVTSVPKAVATPPAFGTGAGTGSGTSGTAGKGNSGAKTTLKLFSPSVASGSQETALITTTPNAMLTVVITYPSGSQQVLGPKKAGADGNFAYSWMVPAGMAGIVHVVVVSSSVAQATFIIQ